MKAKKLYILFYFMGLVEWAVIFCFLGMLPVSHWRLWLAYLLIALISAIGFVAMYATRGVVDQVVRLKYRVTIFLVLSLCIGACFWWALALSKGSPPMSLDVASTAAAVILAGVCWCVYRLMLSRKNLDEG